MTVLRSERFDTDLEKQFRWYLLETDLDPVDALALATRFADAVDAALEFLRRNPEIGRRRFRTYPELAETRSWQVRKIHANDQDLLGANRPRRRRSEGRRSRQRAIIAGCDPATGYPTKAKLATLGLEWTSA